MTIEKLKIKLKNIPASIWILAAIIIVGIFLRSYQLHNWLDFGSDQVNDAVRVGDVVEGKASWPLLGPDMSSSGSGGRDNRFRIGPMYYYFEIVSAKIFGNYPDKMAYPDLLFGILSIPLLFIFLKKYFNTNLTLALTGVYTISFYSLSFSHSAWNPNSIPFFVLLFLLSWMEFLIASVKVHWGWIITLGISIGVGVQLHAILLILLPVTSFFLCIYLIKINPKIWKKFIFVFLAVLILNAGQIVSEQKNNFANTKIFLESALGANDVDGDSEILPKLAENIDCHIAANAYMVSSIGEKDCQFLFTKTLNGDNETGFFKKNSPLVVGALMIASLIFSIFGYCSLAYFFRKEKEKIKKYFLGLVILYSSLSFLVLLPVIEPPLRYFVHVIFVPFIFIGFLINFLVKKYPNKYLWLAGMVFLLLGVGNFISIRSVTDELFAGARSGPDALVLGEVEKIDDFLIAQSGFQKNIYLCTSGKYVNFFKSLEYVAEKKNIDIVRSKSCDNIPRGEAAFFLWQSSKDDPGDIVKGNKIESYKNFGQVGIYKLQ